MVDFATDGTVPCVASENPSCGQCGTMMITMRVPCHEHHCEGGHLCLNCGAHSHHNVSVPLLSDFDRGLYIGFSPIARQILSALFARAENPQAIAEHLKTMIDGLAAGEDG